MSEYWKSTPKYWCKHCSAYVKDTPFERKQHENTAKHQSSLKRFLRDIQNNHERGERDKIRAKSEVERLKGVAGGDTNTSTSSQPPQSSRSTHLTGSKPTTGPQSEVDRKRQWAQLAEMGIKVPEGFRSEMAMTGDWQTLKKQVVDETLTEPLLSTGVKKRKYEGQEEDEEEKEAAGEAIVRRGWGATTKDYPGRDTTDLDDLLSSSVSVKKENLDLRTSPNKRSEPLSPQQGDRMRQAKDEAVPGNSPKAEDSSANVAQNSTLVKEESETTAAAPSIDRIPEEVSIPVFKKRKAKAS